MRYVYESEIFVLNPVPLQYVFRYDLSVVNRAGHMIAHTENRHIT